MKLFGEKILMKSVRPLPLHIKSVNSIQKYLPIAESYACILKFFYIIADSSIIFLIYIQFQTFQNYSTLSFNAWKAIQWVPISEHLSRFVSHAPSFIFSGELSLE